MTVSSGLPEDAVQQPSGLYVLTGIAPETLFQSIGRLRKEAQDEIDRLFGFFDAIDDPDLEDDETESDPDREPSLGTQETAFSTWTRAGGKRPDRRTRGRS